MMNIEIKKGQIESDNDDYEETKRKKTSKKVKLTNFHLILLQLIIILYFLFYCIVKAKLSKKKTESNMEEKPYFCESKIIFLK
jgi:hypothetical protein